MKVPEHTRLLPFQKSDLASLVAFWNNSFADRRNFYPITADDFQRRIINCEAFDPDGLILAWHDDAHAPPQLVGIVHGLRPPPQSSLYAKWEARHHIALLFVEPSQRGRGIGSRLLRAVENWLYYCPVHVGGAAEPCYGTIEGPCQPFFGSTQRMGISVHDSLLINFLAHRGYHVVDPGEISMRLTLSPALSPTGSPFPQPEIPDWAALGLHLIAISHEHPFQGSEPPGREEYTLYGSNGGSPYFGYILATAAGLLQAHISWYPMHPWQPGRPPSSAAIAGFWVSPELRGKGLGRYLLDHTLHTLAASPPPWGGYETVEVQTHLVKHAQAAALYERRGFVTEMAWVNMSKECAVRGVKSQGMSAY